ncbi:tetratricopeptide repeat protein, partial [Streptomyces sp. NPDC004059]
CSYCSSCSLPGTASSGTFRPSIRLSSSEGKLQGVDHPDTLDSRHTLAASLHGLGEYAQAAELHRQTLEDQTRILGPDHRDTLRSRSNLAASLHGLGEYAQAAELHRQTLEDRTRTLGPQHPDTLRSRSDLELTFAASRAGRRRWVR